MSVSEWHYAAGMGHMEADRICYEGDQCVDKPSILLQGMRLHYKAGSTDVPVGEFPACAQAAAGVSSQPPSKIYPSQCFHSFVVIFFGSVNTTSWKQRIQASWQ